MKNLTHEEVGNAYDELAKFYDGAFLRNIDLAENEFVYSLIEQFHLNKGRVLDVGSGTGLFLERYKKTSSEYIGIDISTKMVEEAKRKFPNNISVADDFLDCEVIKESFDNVVSLFGSFSYILNPHKALSMIVHSLKPNGRFMLMLFGHNYLQRHSYIANRYDLFIPTIFYTKNMIMNMLNGYDLPIHNTHIIGMNRFGDKLSGILSVEKMQKYLNIESSIFTKNKVNEFYYLILIGEKNASYNDR